jgi:hypothetical protein
MLQTLSATQLLVERRMADAARGDGDACYELGICYSTGSGGVAIDLGEAHKWFNLAAMAGLEAAPSARAEVADGMTGREIAAAQRAARAWIATARSRPAA